MLTFAIFCLKLYTLMCKFTSICKSSFIFEFYFDPQPTKQATDRPFHGSLQFDCANFPKPRPTDPNCANSAKSNANRLMIKMTKNDDVT